MTNYTVFQKTGTLFVFDTTC